jgi:spore maturation protein CgeB
MSLHSHFAYRKFARPPYRFLMIDAGLHLQTEMGAALRSVGHLVESVPLCADNPQGMLSGLLRAAVAFRPDAILTENHAGFDSRGSIGATLNDLDLPVIVWYLDDFRFLIGEDSRHAFPRTLVCTFERRHVPLLQALGFRHVHHLPSACAIEPGQATSPRNDLARATSFIGDTFESAKAKRFDPSFPARLDALVAAGMSVDPGVDLVAEVLRRQGAGFASRAEAYRYAGYVLAHATQRYRQVLLSQVVASDLHVFGDETWRSLGLRAAIHGPTDPAAETPAIYRDSAVVLNLSSPQLITAVNLRVFDVPAAGGLLLTDWREDLDLLFDVSREVLVFRSVPEMNDLIAHYERRPAQREQLIAAGRARVLRDHRLEQRMQQLAQLAEEAFR